MELENKLKEISNNVNELLKFAEAKNAGLIAFNCAVALAMVSLLNGELSQLWKYLIIYIIGMNIISLFIVMSSLFAQTNPKNFKQKIEKDDNLLFIGTISHMTPKTYIEKLKEKYNLESTNENLEIDLARQLIIISQITARKFNLFNIALCFTFAGIFTPLGFLIHHHFFNPNKK
ncbi:hypothetical protein BEH94_02490 [Candidatus Altiarchaeales archaeon WOR_SM1_SCG]|nr:hypothetical protein BEH94_02490 [Candidatus Altiarchaeales archaeon WOR_SM1_SCG]